MQSLRKNHLRTALVFDYNVAGLGRHYTTPPARNSQLSTTQTFVYNNAGLGTHYTMQPLRKSHLRTTLVFVYRGAGLETRYTLPPSRKNNSCGFGNALHAATFKKESPPHYTCVRLQSCGLRVWNSVCVIAGSG